MIQKWDVHFNRTNNPKKCVVALPGRGEDAEMMIDFARAMHLDDVMLISFHTPRRTWYSMPKSPEDQKEAVDDLLKAIFDIDVEILKVQKAFNLSREDIAIMGFSAGGVMALNVAAHSKKPFAASICLSGAILDPSIFPKCKKAGEATSYLIQHNWDDTTFDWHERYEPMKNCLIENGYKLSFFEEVYGGHRLTMQEVILCAEFLAPILNLKEDWVHPHLEDDPSLSSKGSLNVPLRISEELGNMRNAMLAKRLAQLKRKS